MTTSQKKSKDESKDKSKGKSNRMTAWAAVWGLTGTLAMATPARGEPSPGSEPEGLGPSASGHLHGAIDPGPEAAPPATTARPQPAAAHGDAEPAPVPPAPGEDEAAVARRQRHRVAVMPRFSYRLGDAGQAVSPAPGFGVGGTFERVYLRLAPSRSLRAEATLGVDFAHDRFATGEQGTVVVGTMPRTFGATRVISETSFILIHTVALRAGRVRPYVTVGGGLGVGYFNSVAMEFDPGSARDAHLLGRATAGVDVAVKRAVQVSLRVDYTAVRGVTRFVTSDGRSLPVFGDLFAIAMGIAYHF